VRKEMTGDKKDERKRAKEDFFFFPSPTRYTWYSLFFPEYLTNVFLENFHANVAKYV
jgi:hypothetical protein